MKTRLKVKRAFRVKAEMGKLLYIDTGILSPLSAAVSRFSQYRGIGLAFYRFWPMAALWGAQTGILAATHILRACELITGTKKANTR